MTNLGGRVALLALVAIWLSPGCGGAAKSTDVADPVAETRPVSALERSGIADVLPRNTALVLVAGNPAEMVDEIGLLQLIEEVDELSEAREEVREEAGFDLLSPQGWTEMGIDVKRPAGVALVDIERELGLFAATLESDDRFVAKLEQLAAKQGVDVEEKVVGTARLLDVSEVVFVLRDSWVFAVVGGDEEGVDGLAATLAAAAPATSLATLPAYEAAVAQLGFGTSLAAWFDFGTVARKNGGDTEIAGELGAVAMGLELRRTAVETRMVMGLASTGKLRRLFGAHSGVPAIVRTAANAPLFLASLAINVPGVLELVAEQDSDDLDDARESTRKALGVDLDRDILPLFTGELGVRVTVDQDKLNQGNPAQAFGGAFALGLRDGTAARPRVEEILAHPTFGLTKSADGLYFQAPPLPWFQVYVGVAGDAVLATTDPDSFELAATGGASFADGVTNPGLSRVLTADGPTFLSALDLGQAIAAGSNLLPGLDDEVAAPTDLPNVGAPEYKKLIDEAASVRATMKAQRAELADLRARVRDLGGRWGSVASTGRLVDFGMRFEGGVFLAANETLSVVVADTVRWMLRLDELDREYKRSKRRHRDLVREARELLGREDKDTRSNTEMAK